MVCVLGMCCLKPTNMLPRTNKICFELKNVNVKEVRLIYKKPLFGPKSLRMTSGTRDLRTPVATPLQPPQTRSGPNRRCAGIRTSRVYSQVISSDIYSLTQNPGSDILNLGSRKFWKFPKTRSFI
jgi:hypothetical protein